MEVCSTERMLEIGFHFEVGKERNGKVGCI